MHLLLIRFSAMGDVAMAVPAIRSLLQVHPQLKVTVVTNKLFRPFFANIERVEVKEADLKGRHKGVLGLWRLSRELGKYDAVADVHGVLRSRILRLFLKGPSAVIDKGRGEKRALVSGSRKEPPNPLKHSVQRYLDVFGRLGVKAELNEALGFQLPSMSKECRLLLSQANRHKIGVAPFAKHFTKMWPLEKSEELVTRLKDQKDTSVFIFCGTGEEAEKVKSWEADNCIVLAGKLSLSDELVLMSHLDQMVTMDSANMHMASLAGTRVVSVWGGTHTAAGFSPLGKKCRTVEVPVASLPCRPCSVFGRADCPEKHFKCMNGISVDQVEAVLAEDLGGEE